MLRASYNRSLHFPVNSCRHIFMGLRKAITSPQCVHFQAGGIHCIIRSVTVYYLQMFGILSTMRNRSICAVELLLRLGSWPVSHVSELPPRLPFLRPGRRPFQLAHVLQTLSWLGFCLQLMLPAIHPLTRLRNQDILDGVQSLLWLPCPQTNPTLRYQRTVL
jgi:hypothetical protein